MPRRENLLRMCPVQHIRAASLTANSANKPERPSNGRATAEVVRSSLAELEQVTSRCGRMLKARRLCNYRREKDK